MAASPAWTCAILAVLLYILISGHDALAAPYDLEADIEHELAFAGLDSRIPQDIIDAVDEGFKSEGEKGTKGYRRNKQAQQSLQGQHASQGQKDRHSEAGGNRKGHEDNARYYKDKHAVVKSANGADYSVSKVYDKGSRTTGFHNVHHKEEYKKNKQFYDVKSQQGHLRRYGDFGQALLAAAGQGANGHKYDGGYRNVDYTKDGFSNTGSLYNTLKQYGAAAGNDGYYANGEKYKNTRNGDKNFVSFG